MTLVQLEYVLAVAESRNFTVAAEKAYVTQPTLSMQIQKLEKELEVEIFDRSTHPIKITPVGEKIIQQAKEILKEANRMQYMVDQQRNSVIGDFRLGVIPTVLPTLVPLFYKSFKQKFPHANLHILELKTEDIIHGLEDDKVDFGIAVSPINDKDIIEMTLYKEPMVAFVPPNHRLSKNILVNQKELKTEDILLLEEGHCFRDNVLAVCNSKNRAELDVAVDSGSFTTLIKLAKDGFGMTLLPSLQAEDLGEEDRKLIKKFQEPSPSREVALIYHHTQLRTRFAEELKKLIQSVIRGKIYLEDNPKIPALSIPK